MDIPEAALALIADLAQSIGAPEIPLGENDGWHLKLGEDDAYLYCRDGKQLLVVIPVAPMPPDLSWAQANELLRENMFDSDFMPFRIANDPTGMVVQWGLVPLNDLNGPSLAELLDRFGRRAQMLRDMLLPSSGAVG